MAVITAALGGGRTTECVHVGSEVLGAVWRRTSLCVRVCECVCVCA